MIGSGPRCSTGMGTIDITCPRCSGKGVRSEWHPDAGVCYRCGGKAFITVDPERRLRALFAARSRYRSLLKALKSSSGEEAREIKEVALPRVERDGKLIRYELNTIVAEHPAKAAAIRLVERAKI